MVNEQKRKRLTRSKRAVTLTVEQETYRAIKQQAEAEGFDISIASWIRAAIREKLQRTKEVAAA
jgi:predicted DNA binding CopG/RHH family protein